jgi:hypothetical protein
MLDHLSLGGEQQDCLIPSGFCLQPTRSDVG